MCRKWLYQAKYKHTINESTVASKMSETRGLKLFKFQLPHRRWEEERRMKQNEKREGRGVSSLKCERSSISLISHPSSSNLLIKQVLQEVKRCVSKPHEDRWHPSASVERDKREWAREIKKKRRLSKLVNTRVTTTGRRRRLRAIKTYKEEDGFTSLLLLCSLLTQSQDMW